MKKILVMIITVTIICMLMPAVAKAATASNNTTFNLSTLSAGEKLTIPSGMAVTLTGTAPTNAHVECEAGVELTLDNATLNCTNKNYTALAFTSGANVLKLIDTSYITSGQYKAGISVAQTSALSISGVGKLYANGGSLGAGIGGGVVHNDENNSNHPDNVGTINIKSGTVKAKGGYLASGIGGGFCGDGGTTIIEGGTVTATGSIDSAGIGGGRKGKGGTITIKGGIVAASRGYYAPYDIGNGSDESGGTLAISGDAAVFLKNNTCIIPTTSHTRITNVNGSIYGISVPSGYDGAGAYILPCTLSYHANGGTGSVPSSITKHKNITVNVGAQGDLTCGTLTFKSWNTSPAGTGAGYAPGSEIAIAGDTTLYAIWAYQDVASITLSEHTLDITQHDTATLVATLEGSGTNRDTVVWYSDNYDVASVDQSGLVTAMGVGSATITAYADGKSDTCTVTVNKKAVTGVTLSATTTSMKLEDTLSLVATIAPSDATYPEVTWTSSDSSVVTVDANGVVTAVGLGDATVQAEADGVQATCAVTVSKIDVDSITLSSNSESLKLGETAYLIATISPNNATYPEVTWTSSDSSVVTVDANGVVTAVGLGDATVQAEADGVLANCDVTVNKVGVTGITLSSNTLLLKLGESANIIASVEPSDATNPDVSWSSSDASVVTVSTNGAVTAVGTGSATITAKADGMSVHCEVKVVLKAEKVTLNQNSAELLVGENIQLNGAVYPRRASRGVTTWESRDESIATVDTSGKVVAVGEGATSVVLTVDGASDACVIMVKSSEQSGDKEEDKDDEPTPTPEPKVTSSPEPTQEKTAAVKSTVIINTSDLPEGTKWVQTSSGEIIPVEGDKVEVDLSGSEPMEIIALDDEKIPLGHMNVNISVQRADNRVPVWVIVLGVLIGALVVGGVVLLVIGRRKR